MAERKSISKKLRFEIFKRDSFTCQYCGQMVPDVILEVDHINPVANGGDNDIINLITSCRDCNRGKSKNILSDDSVVKKQQKQLKELNDKRLQLAMMIEWKKELKYLMLDQVIEIENLFEELTGVRFTEHGRGVIASKIKEFGFSEVYDSTVISIGKYFIKERKEETSATSFKKIGGICYNRRKKREDTCKDG